MDRDDFINRCGSIIQPMTIEKICGMLDEYYKVGFESDTMLKNTTSRIYNLRLDEVTPIQIKEVTFIIAILLSKHLTNSLKIYLN